MQYVGARRSSATKQMSLFHQPGGIKFATGVNQINYTPPRLRLVRLGQTVEILPSLQALLRVPRR